jgi:hypothetical protein
LTALKIGLGGEEGRVGLVYFFHTCFLERGMGEKLFRGLGGEKLSSSFFL